MLQRQTSAPALVKAAAFVLVPQMNRHGPTLRKRQIGHQSAGVAAAGNKQLAAWVCYPFPSSSSSSSGFFFLDCNNPDLDRSLAPQADLLGRSAGEVDQVPDCVTGVAAVIDDHRHLLAALDICDRNHGSQRQQGMGSGQSCPGDSAGRRWCADR
jgi:hypothetical protein